MLEGEEGRTDSVEGGWVEFYRFTTGGSGCDLAASEYLPNPRPTHSTYHPSSRSSSLLLLPIPPCERVSIIYDHRVIQLLDHAQDCWSAKNGGK